MRRQVSILLGAAVLVSMLGACAPSGNEPQVSQAQESQQPQETQSAGTVQDTIVYTMTTAPTASYFPMFSTNEYADTIAKAIYSSLMVAGPEGELENLLAKEATVSEDGLTYTYTIYDGVKWTDGEPLTTEDIAFTFTCASDADYAGPHSGSIGMLAGATEYAEGTADSVSGIQVIDETTISFTLKEPYAGAAAMFGTIGIIPKHIWQDIPVAQFEKESELIANAVGCGPYIMEEFKTGQYVKLKANPDFYLGEPVTENIIFKVVNADSLMAEIKAGEVDIVNVSDLSTAEIQELENAGMKLTSAYSALYQEMGFNRESVYFSDVQVRKAVNYAINRQGMVDTLLEGRGMVIDTPIVPSSWAYPTGDSYYPYDPEQAKTILAEAGWTDTDGDGILENADGVKFSVKLICPTGLEAREKSAVIIQDNLKDVGIEVEVDYLEFSAFFEPFYSGDYGLYLLGLSTDSPDPDPSSTWLELVNDEVDEVILAARSTTDQEERKELYREMTRLINENPVMDILYSQEIIYACDPGISGFEHSIYNWSYHIYDWCLTR